MVKVAYIVSTLVRSGPNNQLFNLIKYLEQEEIEPHIITLSPEPEDSRWADFEELGVPLCSLNQSRVAGFIKGGTSLKNILNEICPDITHTMGFRPDFFASRTLRDFRQVSTLHNYPFQDYPRTYGRPQGYIMARLHLQFLKKINQPRVVSEAVSKMLLENQDFKIRPIQNSVDDELFYPVNAQKKIELRRKLNLPEQKRILVSTGHLSPLKDPLTVLRAFQKANITDTVLVFLGDGSLRQQCEEEIHSNAIRLCGRVDNVSEYLQASDGFVSGSHAEGLPTAVMEAMASGLPVILSDILPHRELVEPNPMAGKLFEVSNVDDLSRKLEVFKNGDTSSMGEAARQVVEERLNAKRMSEQYQDLYKSLAATT
jgi:glycosyltransferase involved in cell wall biosynthesis